MKRRRGNRGQTLRPGHPCFRLRARQAYERESPVAVILNVEHIARAGRRQHNALLAIRSRRHGGIIPLTTHTINRKIGGCYGFFDAEGLGMRERDKIF